ncbi:MAG: IPT/TIG domain-containing protein [Bacteroidota bacterium]
MKNLFLPFVVVVLFSLGSCDDSTINPPQSEELNQVEILSFTPDSAYIGEIVKITGKNFSAKKSENNVWFAPRTAAVIDSATSTQLTVRVPAGAVTGSIIVSNGTYTDTSVNAFKILKLKLISIKDFSPKSGYDGTLVTISGVNFGSDKNKAHVYINDKEAEIIEISQSIIKAEIPKDAASGAITVVVNNESVVSDSIFTAIPRPFPVVIKSLDSVSAWGIPFLVHTKATGYYGSYDSNQVRMVGGFVPSSALTLTKTQTTEKVNLQYSYSSSNGVDPRDASSSTISLSFDIDYTQKIVSSIRYAYNYTSSVIHTAGPTRSDYSSFSFDLKEATYTIAGKNMIIDLSASELQNSIQSISSSASGDYQSTGTLKSTFISRLPLEDNSRFTIVLKIE